MYHPVYNYNLEYINNLVVLFDFREQYHKTKARIFKTQLSTIFDLLSNIFSYLSNFDLATKLNLKVPNKY